MTSDLIKEMEEDPALFMRSCLFIPVAGREGREHGGKVPFQPRDYQIEIARRWNTPTGRPGQFRFEFILKARKLGITTLACAFSVHQAVMFPNSKIAIIANKQDTAMNILSKCAFMLKNLPEWVCTAKGFDKPDKRTGISRERIELGNGSEIMAYPLTGAGTRSDHLTFAFFDEIDHAEEPGLVHYAMDAIRDSNIGGTIIAATTPMGYGLPAWRLWHKGEGDLFEKHFLPWTLVAKYDKDRTVEWRESLISAHEHEPWRVYREHPETVEEAFMEASLSKFPVDLVRKRLLQLNGKAPLMLEKFDRTLKKRVEYEYEEPEFKRYEISFEHDRAVKVEAPQGSLTVWHEPQPDHEYAAFFDCSWGITDPTCGYIRDIETLQQVCEWRGLIDPKPLAKIAFVLGAWYNDAQIGAERQGGGYTMLKTLDEDLGYGNLYREMYTAVDGRTVSPRIGWTTLQNKRNDSIETLKDLFISRPETFHSLTQLGEMLSFIPKESGRAWAEGGRGNRQKYAAAAGEHDDTISSDGPLCVICLKLRGSDLMMDPEDDKDQIARFPWERTITKPLEVDWL